MIRYGRRHWLLAAALSSVAGYVDALGFMQSRGFFVSFMSGNSTRLAVSLVHGWAMAATAAGLLACFVAGVTGGALLGHQAGGRRAPVVLAGVAALLALGAALAPVSPWTAIALMAVAMGAENAVFQREGEVSIGVTYMTGTLVKMGQRIATALTGGARFAWAPYALLWLGLLAGAVVGAGAFRLLGLNGLWLAAAAAAILALIAGRLGEAEPR